jgi:hypothetical protein
MPSIGQTWVLASIGAVIEMGILSTLKRLLMESRYSIAATVAKVQSSNFVLVLISHSFCDLLDGRMCTRVMSLKMINIRVESRGRTPLFAKNP